MREMAHTDMGGRGAGGFVAADEYMHEPTADPQFNESMYFNFVDPASGHSLLIRMGNRANEGFAEVTVLLYRPGGGAAIHFERAPISDNSRFDAGGLRFQVLEPLQRLRVTYSGPANLLAKGLDLADPGPALKASPIDALEIDLEYQNLIPVYGLAGNEDAVGGIAGGEETIASRHYQVPCRVRGTVRLEGEVHQVDALGYRDHSWGPRKWQAPRYWRWISGICDERNVFVGWVTRVGDQRPPGNGMVLRDGRPALVREVRVQSTYGAPPHYPETMALELKTDAGVFRVTGRVLALVPLRHRREGSVARLAEAVCEYQLDGLTGYGFSEYHDLIEDGLPVGITEA